MDTSTDGSSAVHAWVLWAVSTTASLAMIFGGVFLASVRCSPRRWGLSLTDTRPPSCRC